MRSHPSTKLVPSNKLLDYQDSYICPVCRHGEITSLTLMDAFACNFCHHIFTANLTQQTLHAADSSQPVAWRWTGQTWRSVHQGAAEVTGLIWFISIVLVILPPAIIGLTTYMLPPPEGTSWSFPFIWTGLTFCAHLSLVSWLLVEYHQFPPYIALKIRLQRLFNPELNVSSMD